jgi:hypothetical protein
MIHGVLVDVLKPHAARLIETLCPEPDVSDDFSPYNEGRVAHVKVVADPPSSASETQSCRGEASFYV